MINMVNVSVNYPDGNRALSDVSISIKKGEFVFLVGPSGAGKSTLEKLVYRECKPNRGQILFNGKNISRLKDREVPYLRRQIGIIFQDFRLMANMTVEENIAFALQVIEASNKDIKRLVPAALKLVGLSSKALMLPAQLSGGEQQRVAIARAIVNNPTIVIADEPTGNLDPDTSWEIAKVLDDIHKIGTTVIMATHDKTIVDAMKKRVVALEKGRIVRDEEKGAYGYED